jgi:hypothetical protein
MVDPAERLPSGDYGARLKELVAAGDRGGPEGVSHNVKMDRLAPVLADFFTAHRRPDGLARAR